MLPGRRRLGEYMALDKTFYNFVFKQEAAATQLISDFLP
jgi:hypothetical protein